MSTPVRVVHLIPTLERAGAEHALARVVAHADAAQVRHTVVSLTERGPLAETIEAAGVEVIALGARSPASTLLRLPRLLAVIRAARPDVVQGWMVHANLLAWLARALAAPSARLAWNLRGPGKGLVHESAPTRALTRAAAVVSRDVDLMIANSTAAMTDHVELGYAPRERALAPNGFDLEHFRPDPAERARMREALGLPADAVAFGLVGRFHPVKGHALFVEAAAEVARLRPRAVFVLAGAGTADAPELDALLAFHGVAGRFIRLGARTDVAAILRALDVACAPSVYESFPNAVGEAMACAVPCVATHISDVRAILADGGLVVPAGDAAALARAMVLLADDAEARERMGRAGRRRAEDHYSIASSARRYDQLYAALHTSRSEIRRGAPA
ncbi:glycosyltransferase [Caulobacter sp. 17J80-11]|uniref:glycosyltransferase n=1 Tax=Caulobacter sp. 17J80-11 TaxID=2763502 RepID=UPI0016538165|nr:glycosyltransferase [Caulobacter sp. 17J80-11]MBC6983389.1 glycosyltransferase [Caulobacter sp. 17J80-11]